ncbi:MAG: hypothetical protein PVJ57_14890 [Phycisphaerae bacterium]|jgi:hypothetical protein
MTTADLTPIPRVDLGDLVAERDRTLKEWYVRNKHLEIASDFQSRKLYFIGKKGSGKSAILQMIRLNQPRDRVIDLSRDDLGLDIIPEYGELRNLTSHSQSLLLRTTWDAVLMLEVYERLKRSGRHAKRSTSYPAFQTLSKRILERRVHPDCATVLRLVLTEVTEAFRSRRAYHEIDVRHPDFTQMLAETEFVSLVHQAKRSFEELVSGRETFVLIDDLDQAWSNDALQCRCLASLFEAIEYFSQVPLIKFVVALRFDIFRKLDLANADKVSQHVHRITWGLDELKTIVMSRMRKALNEAKGRVAKRFDLPHEGDAVRKIVSTCLPHPRDVIAMFQLLLDEAEVRHATKVNEDILAHVSGEMSGNRVRWVRDEWKPTYPWLDATLHSIAKGVHIMKYDELVRHVCKVTDEPPDAVIEGLLNTGLVGMKGKPGGEARYFIHEPAHAGPYNKTTYFEMHPAVAKALQANRW